MEGRMVDRGATPSQVVSAWWHDRVFVTITAVAVMAWLGAVGLMIKWSFLLHKLAVPLTVWLYSRPGHVLTPKGDILYAGGELRRLAKRP